MACAKTTEKVLLALYLGKEKTSSKKRAYNPIEIKIFSF
jgi:hypothetical protein